MNFSEQEQAPSKKLVSITIVIVIHVLVLYALLNGLGKQIVIAINSLPIQTVLIEEVKPPAPPAPPTPVPPSPPKRVAPPKPFIPKPEVAKRQAPSPHAIEAVTSEPPPKSDLPIQAPAVAEPAKGPSVTRAVVDFSTCEKPEYPPSSLRNEEQGTVRIQFLVGLDGQVADSKIDKSSGFRSLDAAAKKALSLCKFKPGMIDGKPQESWTVVNYVWKLPD